MRHCFIITALSAIFTAPNSICSEPYSPVVGQSHPDFTLPNIRDGKPVSLSDFRGKKVLLIQFASW